MLRIAFVSTYTPRPCGTAVFTQSLAAAVGGREVVALQPGDEMDQFPIEVRHRIRRDELADYRRVAEALNDGRADVVSIQHDEGIWGGDDGAFVVDFVRSLHKPIVTTLHSVFRHPTPAQRRIVRDLADASRAVVVMSTSAATALTIAYGVDPAAVEVVPHGVPDLPLVEPDTAKPRLDLQGCSVILSSGFLRPGRGFESVIEAMPAVVAADPSACYVILGANHADHDRGEVEAYRLGLEAAVARLRLGGHVRLIDHFVGRVEFGTWLQAADVFVSPYPDLDRVASGTLASAMGAGKAIVSTAYAYAAEVLAGGTGLLLAPGSPSAMADAVIGLLRDPDLRARLGRQAYEQSRGMVWWRVAEDYRRLLSRVAREVRPPVIPTGATAAHG